MTTKTTKKTQFIVMDKAACMPSSCRGRYRRVAVVEVEAGAPEPRMISERARGVVRIVQTWERRNVGRTDRDAFSRALREANEMVEFLTTKSKRR